MAKEVKISLKEFLKKYTAVSSKFIDEYYVFYEKCEMNKYGILLDDVETYLGIKKIEKFRSNIRKKYIENIDYVKIINEKKNRTRYDKYNYYYLSLDTFEKICMMSKSKKANSVRDYFIILRKFIQYYKDHISEMIINKVTKKKYGYIYIILVEKNKKIFKIGRSSDIKSRLKTYGTGSAVHPDIKFIMLVDNESFAENCVKKLIKNNKFKPNKEVYKVDFDILKQMIADCATLHKKYHEINNQNNVDSYIIFEDNE